MTGLQELGALIKSARENLGMTGAELAQRLERPHSFVVRLERGQNSNPPDPQTFSDIARELRISKEEMLRALGYLDADATEGTEVRRVPVVVERALEGVEWNEETAQDIATMIRMLVRRRPTSPTGSINPNDPYYEDRPDQNAGKTRRVPVEE